MARIREVVRLKGSGNLRNLLVFRSCVMRFTINMLVVAQGACCLIDGGQLEEEIILDEIRTIVFCLYNFLKLFRDSDSICLFKIAIIEFSCVMYDTKYRIMFLITITIIVILITIIVILITIPILAKVTILSISQLSRVRKEIHLTD